MSTRKINVGIVGATGLVGEKMREILTQRAFPVNNMRLFASPRSAGRKIRWNGNETIVEDASSADYRGLDLVFFSAGAKTSRELANKVADCGPIVIDNSSAWRSDPDVPLVVAEVNATALATIPKGIVANPNCTTMIAMPVLMPLHREAALVSVVASTYQAVSGGGVEGIRELDDQLDAVRDSSKHLVHDGSAVDFPEPKKWSVPIAHNVIPMNYTLAPDGNTDEEVKFINEARRILDQPGLSVSITCVRVPVYSGHSLSINARFSRPISVARAAEILNAAPGVKLMDVPNPIAASGGDVVLAGRVRTDTTVENGLALFVSGDNLRKGAALNAIEIAEKIFLCREAYSR